MKSYWRNDEIAHAKKPSGYGFDGVIDGGYQSWVGDKILGINVIIFICQVSKWWAIQILDIVDEINPKKSREITKYLITYKLQPIFSLHAKHSHNIFDSLNIIYPQLLSERCLYIKVYITTYPSRINF